MKTKQRRRPASSGEGQLQRCPVACLLSLFSFPDNSSEPVNKANSGGAFESFKLVKRWIINRSVRVLTDDRVDLLISRIDFYPVGQPLSSGAARVGSGKGLKIMNLNEARATEGVPVLPDDDDDAVDPHLERIKNEAGGDDSDEEDEDFVLDKDDGGSPTDDSGGDESDASGGEEEKPAKKKPKKEGTVSKPSTSWKKADDDGSKKKKQKKKKDPNAPKRAISAFMYFSQSERENVKKSNPGIAFTEVGRVLGERWNKLSAEEKEPFEAMAKADKKRYSEQISDYKNPQPTVVDSGNESGSS